MVVPSLALLTVTVPLLDPPCMVTSPNMSVSPMTLREFLTVVVPATPPIANWDALVAKLTVVPAPPLVRRLIV